MATIASLLYSLGVSGDRKLGQRCFGDLKDVGESQPRQTSTFTKESLLGDVNSSGQSRALYLQLLGECWASSICTGSLADLHRAPAAEISRMQSRLSYISHPWGLQAGLGVMAEGKASCIEWCLPRAPWNSGRAHLNAVLPPGGGITKLQG